MIKKTAPLSLILIIFSSTYAFSGVVGTGSVGVALPSLESGNSEEGGDAGYMVGGSIGWRFSGWVQWDILETYYMSADQHDSYEGYMYTGSNWTIGSGLRFGRFTADSRFHPYVSGGVAGSRTTIESGSVYIWQWGFEWNAGVGFLYDVGESTGLGIRYRYRSTDIPSILGYPVDLNVNIHTVAVEFVWGS